MRRLLLVCGLLPTLLVSDSAHAAQGDAPADKPATKAKAGHSSDELLSDAIGAVKDSDLPKAVKKLETLLKSDRQNREALVLLAKIRLQQAMEQPRPESSPLFLNAARRAREVLALAKKPTKHEQAMLATIFYYEAATHAVNNQPKKALAALTDAYRQGFADVDALDTDEDLAALRDSSDFRKLRGQVEDKARPIARERAKELLAANKPFPFDFALRDVEGKPVSLADYKGKVTIVDVWGTWCPPCRMEIPHFVKLYERFHDRGLEIVGVNFEREDDDAKAASVVRKFAKEHGLPYKCVLGNEKVEKAIPNFQGFPTTLFIGRDGTVRLKAVGYHPLIDLEAIVERLLNEGAKDG